MLSTNKSNVVVKVVVLFFLISFFNPLYVSASSTEKILQKKGYSEWGYFLISESFNGEDNRGSKNRVETLFHRKKIIFNGNVLSINDVCTYKYAAKLTTPLSFWGSSKTVNYYKMFFSDYKIKMPTKFLEITPVNPIEDCEFPFSEFIVLDDEVIFFYENYAVFYFKTPEVLKAHKKNNEGNAALVKKKEIGISKVCKGIERNTNNYNTSRECFYNGMNLIDTYREYRSELTNHDGKYLQNNIIPNKDFSIKCDDECIAIIYKWNGTNKLVITQQFDGGETEISFNKEEQGCRVVTKSFPD